VTAVEKISDERRRLRWYACGMKSERLSKAASELGRRGGQVTGKSKRRGGKTRAEWSAFYRALGIRSGKARRASRNSPGMT